MKISELKEGSGASLVRYTEKKVADYNELDRNSIIESREINIGLIDSYSVFDLSEISLGVDERETEWLESELKLGDHRIECDINTDNITEFMAIECGRYFENEIDGLELRVVEVFSPSEYNYTTDSCEFEIVKNPFESKEKLVEKMREVAGGDELDDEYRWYLYASIEEYMTERIAGYYLDNGQKSYSFDELKEKLGAREV